MAGAVKSGVGLTVMVKEVDGPEQLFAVGVTVMVATMGVGPVFTAVNAGILPVPPGTSPMDGLLFDQSNVVPGVLPVKVTAAVFEPLQSVWLPGCVTSGVGLTVMINVWEVPTQVFAVGVTLSVAATGVKPPFVAVNEAILPVPEAARPMEGVLFVQANVAPLTLLLKLTAVVGAPLHAV